MEAPSQTREFALRLGRIVNEESNGICTVQVLLLQPVKASVHRKFEGVC